MFKVDVYYNNALFDNGSFRENPIVTITMFAPNHVIPYGNIYADLIHSLFID